MPVYCITGTNRGLGLEFVRQLAQDPANTILATTRPSADTTDLRAVASDNTHVLPCDTADVESIRAFAKEAVRVLGGRKIDHLINNAGLNQGPAGESSLNVDAKHIAVQLAINVVGPAKVVQFLLEAGALATAVRVLNLTSGLSSMAITVGGSPRYSVGYSISKAGLNMLAIHQSADLRAKLDGAVVVVIDPGWVKTRMGGDGAMLEPDVSISGMLKVLHALEDKDNGKFYSYDGSTVEW